MHRKRLCAAMVGCALAGIGSSMVGAIPLRAQTVPARDLWDFPLGAVGAPAALAVDAGVGLWNPAMMGLPESMRWRAGVASLSTGVDQGVEAQLVGVSYRRDNGVSLGLSVARAAVSGLIRTDTDPQSLGSLAYESHVTSLTVTRTVLPWLTVGTAARWRHGRAERDVRSALAADIGVLAHAPAAVARPLRDARVALGTFLWRPGREPEDRTLVTLAADARALGRSGTAELRLGVAAQGSTRGQRDRSTSEFGPIASGRLGPVEARIAVPFVRGSEQDGLTRVRFSLALHLSRFTVGVGREDANVGLGPLYQFSFSAFAP